MMEDSSLTGVRASECAVVKAHARGCAHGVGLSAQPGARVLVLMQNARRG